MLHRLIGKPNKVMWLLYIMVCIDGRKLIERRVKTKCHSTGLLAWCCAE